MVFCVWQSEQTNTAGDPGKGSCIQRKDRKESSRVIQSACSPQGSPSSGYPPLHTQAAQVNTFLSPKEGFPAAMTGSLLFLKPNSDLPTPFPDIPTISQKGAETSTSGQQHLLL